MIYTISKRLLDIALSLFGLFIFSPLMLIIAVLIFLTEGLPICYVKKTTGKNEKVFYAIKFRSMKKDPKTITKIGRILRNTAMDELPQLINICKGEMSFVGPRPYSAEKCKSLESIGFSRRLSITPGLTGLSQISVLKHTTDEEVLRYDLEYMKRRNFWFDLYIIFISVWITLKGAWESTVKKL